MADTGGPSGLCVEKGANKNNKKEYILGFTLWLVQEGQVACVLKKVQDTNKNNKKEYILGFTLWLVSTFQQCSDGGGGEGKYLKCL